MKIFFPDSRHKSKWLIVNQVSGIEASLVSENVNSWQRGSLPLFPVPARKSKYSERYFYLSWQRWRLLWSGSNKEKGTWGGCSAIPPRSPEALRCSPFVPGTLAAEGSPPVSPSREVPSTEKNCFILGSQRPMTDRRRSPKAWPFCVSSRQFWQPTWIYSSWGISWALSCKLLSSSTPPLPCTVPFHPLQMTL